jgi:hypothetical protein
MVPGLSLFRALAGALQLARLADAADAETVARTFGSALQGTLVVGGLALGLILGARAMHALARERQSPMGSRMDREAVEAAHRAQPD